MDRIRGFVAFWYDFIVGDDWRVAAGLALALLLTWILTHADVNAWWLMPPAVAGLLWLSLAREVRRATRN
jgi:hypothetical protein